MAKVAAEVGSTANRYQILGRIAVGGMAEIFLARGANATATGLERYCVLKRILRERASDAQFVQMFLDEARLAAQLQHPNIASVYDIGMLGDSYFFTMEYVHGETVRSVLERAHQLQRPVPLACVLTIVAGAAAGLHHAHERVSGDGRPLGIVHRDVSPSNLMVSYEGNVKLVDFGVAKAADRPVETQSGTVKGKISYLSPEQCRGARVDRRSDLFSLGIVMWETLTGARLYRRNSDFENMTAIVHEPPPRPSSRRPEVPRAVDDIVLRLLAKPVADRFQTAGEVVEAIENASMRAGTILSTSAVSRLVRDLFGVRPEPWLELDTLTAPLQRVTLASRPLPKELGRTPPDPVELELAAVPDLSISSMLEVLDDVSTASEPEIEPEIEPDTTDPDPGAPPPAPVWPTPTPGGLTTPVVRAHGAIPSPIAAEPPTRRVVQSGSSAPPSAAEPPAMGRRQSAPSIPAASRPSTPIPALPPAAPSADPPASTTTPPQPLPAVGTRFSPSALLDALSGLPLSDLPASATTLLGVSAPASVARMRPSSFVLATASAAPVREPSPAASVAPTSSEQGAAGPSAMASPNPALAPAGVAPPSSPWSPTNAPPANAPPANAPQAAPRFSSAPAPSAALGSVQRSGPAPAHFVPPGFARPSPAFAPSSPATPRAAGTFAPRFTPWLIAVMVLAAAAGAIAAWLSMRGDHRAPPAAQDDHAAAPRPALTDAGSPATSPAAPVDPGAAPPARPSP